MNGTDVRQQSSPTLWPVAKYVPWEYLDHGKVGVKVVKVAQARTYGRGWEGRLWVGQADWVEGWRLLQQWFGQGQVWGT